MFAQSEELPELLQWLIEWRKGQDENLKVFAINNEGKELNDYRIQKFKLYRCFDGFISSCEVGMRKTDPGMFSLAMGIVHVTPDECLYIDDRLMIVQAARGAGIKSIQHKTAVETKAFLEQCVPVK